MKNKEIKIYKIGEAYACDKYICEKYAIRVKDIPDIEEARKIINDELLQKWKEVHIKMWGHEKITIAKEEKTYVRNVGRWVEYGYEYKDYDFVHTYEISEKGGRGAMLCWVFYVEDRDVFIYLNVNKG